MDNQQRAKFESFQRVQACNTAYAADLAIIEDYAALQSDFDELVGQVMLTAAQQEETTGVTTELLQVVKRGMAETVVEFASRGLVKAQLAGNGELANQLDVSVSYIFRAGKLTSVQRALELRNLMNDNLAVLTNITAENIAAIDAAISAYTAIMNQPVIGIQRKKSQATDALPTLFKAADKLLDNMFRLAKSYFFRTKPALVNEMALAMQIINTGIRHTPVNIIVLAAEDDAVVEGAVALDNSNGRSYTSDYAGLVHIDKHRSGHSTFTLSAPDRQGITVGIDIRRATDNRLTVKLARV